MDPDTKIITAKR